MCMSEFIIKTEGAVIRQQKNTILKEVNIEIKSGEFVYIIGKVGSGKSSFLKTLYAELPLEFGKAEVAGFQLSRIKKSQIPLLRRKCGIVFQDFKLLTDRNVYANLEFVLKATGWNNKKTIQERIETVLNKVDMLEKKEKMPHQLSGGEQQRIVLARALLNAPPLILADEPTGNIDPETSYRLIELLREICETGKTIIIATHQYDLIEKYPGRVLRCENGLLFEDTKSSAYIAPEEIVAEIDEPANDTVEIIEELTDETPAWVEEEMPDSGFVMSDGSEEKHTNDEAEETVQEEVVEELFIPAEPEVIALSSFADSTSQAPSETAETNAASYDEKPLEEINEKESIVDMITAKQEDDVAKNPYIPEAEIEQEPEIVSEAETPILETVQKDEPEEIIFLSPTEDEPKKEKEKPTTQSFGFELIE